MRTHECPLSPFPPPLGKAFVLSLCSLAVRLDAAKRAIKPAGDPQATRGRCLIRNDNQWARLAQLVQPRC